MKFGTLQVFPRSGLLQEHGLDLPSAIVGRGEGSAIRIDDFSISRRHARLTVDSGRLLVEDLGSAAGTFVDGEKLEPGVRHLVEDDAVLRFGEIEARYQAPVGADAILTPESVPDNVAIVSVGGLSIALISPDHPIDPGKQAGATLVVTNRGRIIDNVTIEVPNLPADWYTVESPQFPILPGGRADVRITLHPPRRHDSVAGQYPFTVRVRSQEYDEHPEAAGTFDVLPFESATLTLPATRSKKNFRLVAENHGNDVARYELSGRDEEQAFKYWFETPTVELQPGQKRIIEFTVKRPRQLFGQPIQPPFEIFGKSAGSGAEISTRGQLAVRPPLERLKMPATFAVVAMLLVITAVAVLIIADGDGTKTASAEDPYAGVHLCEDEDAKEEQEKRNADAANDRPLTSATVVGPYDGGRAIFGEVDRNGAPFFAQSDPRWAAEEYARSTELPSGKDWCGTTIEQCGCAMTSVSVMLALYDLMEMPDGQPLSPESLNSWFNGAARQTDRGWVSRGYIYGDVIWAAANELSGEIAKVNPAARTVRFVRTGSGSEEEIRADLNAGRPVILEVPGHWIAAVGLDGDDILINDPFYRDRKTLSAYAGKVRSSVHYEPSEDLSSVVITAPSDVKFKVTDKQGRVVNTGTGTIEQPADVINQIPGASLAQRSAWRDPTCIEQAPPAGAGTNQVVLPGSRDDYIIEILDTGNQPASVAIHTYGRDGTSSIATIEGVEGTQAEVSFDPNADKPVINITSNGTPVPTATPPASDGGGGGDDTTPTPAATPPPATATATPFVEQRTAMTLPAEPGQTRVEVATNSGFELGDPIRFAPGMPNEEDNIIVGFGSFLLATPLRFAHSPGEPIQRLPRPPGQGPGLPPGITPPPSTGPIEPPDSVLIQCSTIYQPSPKLATLICDLTVAGDFTTTRWTFNGRVVTEFSGSTSMVLTFPDNVPANISATVCNVTLCRSTSRLDQVEFPPGITGPTLSGGGTSGSGSPAAVPTPAGSAVTITCGTEFDQTQVPAVANITCQANFSGEFTTVSWSAPGGTPASASSRSTEFQTQLVNDLGAPSTLKITATVCNFGTCRTSNAVPVGIGQTRVIVDAEPKNPVTEEREVHQRHTVTLFAAVVGLNGIVPQGGNVQFYADDNEISPSAALFTVGSTSVAQIAVETGSRAGLTTVGTHTIYAVYSGGINAFGNTSEEMQLEVLDPLPDQCDSVDEDGNDVIDDFTSGGGDTSCDITVPRNLGAGTVLNSLLISTGNPSHQDGAPNAVVVPPGQPMTVTGTVGRTEYCPGCIRQVYLGIGGYDTQAAPTRIGPACVYSGGTPQIPTAFGTFPVTFNAPTTPGVYYIRATTTLDYFCVGPPVGPPDRSVGRIVVKGPVVAQIEIYPASSPTDTNPWDDLLTTQAASVAAGDRLIILARVPAGASGRVDIQGVAGLALSPPVCPSAGQVVIPSIQATPIACTPGEARVMTPPITDDLAQMLIRGRYEDGFPAQLTSPATNDAVEYPFFESPPQVDPGPYPAGPPGLWTGSNVVAVKVLVTPSIVVTAVPNPVEMGEVFTLTATVTSANAALALTGQGGAVQFMAGTVPIGSQVVSSLTNGVNGVFTIQWMPRNCNGVVNCGAGNQGHPFDSQDRNGAANLYTNVHAVFSAGTSDLKGGTSSNIDVDVDKATSSVSLTVNPASIIVGATIDLTATVASLQAGVTPSGGQVQFRVRGSTQSLGSAVNLGSPVTLVNNLGVWTAVIDDLATGVTGNPIATSGDYLVTAHFLGTNEVAISVSADSALTVSRASASVAVTLPGSGTITVGDTGNIRAVVTGSPNNQLDNSPARLKLFNGTTELADMAVTNLGGNVMGADFPVSTLAAGSYSITVEYTGNSSFNGVTSAAQAFQVNQFTPTVTLNAMTAVAVGSNLSMSAGVSGSGSLRTPTGGTVSFYINSVAAANLIGTATVSGGTATLGSVATGDTAVCGDTGQTACFRTAGTATTVIAGFNGLTNVSAASSATGSVTLTKRNSNVSVSGSTAVLGTDLTLNATVTAASTPTSAVSVACTACLQFQVDVGGTWTDIGTDRDVASNGTASLTQSTTTGPLAANGSYSIRAVYANQGSGAGQTTNGHVNYNTDTSGTATATVGPPPPTVTLGNETMPLNGSATLEALVVPPTGRVPTCSNCLQFKVGTVLATATTFATVSVTEITSGSGTYHATTTISGGSTAFPTISGSPYTVWAVYAPSGGTGATGTADDVGGPANSAAASVAVTARAVTVSVSANSSVTLGNSITLTATLSPSASPGTVRFFADGTEVTGTDGVAADVSDGTTTFSWSPTSVGDGTATITATYTSSDTTNYASQATSSSDNVTVNPATTTIVATGADVGATVTLTANVTSGFPSTGTLVDGGTVTWTITAGAGTCTGLATANVVDGVATLTGVTCPAGNNYNVRGTYSGAGDYAASADTTDSDLDVN